MENKIRQGYKLEVSKNLSHHLEGRLINTFDNNEIELSKEELASFNKFLVVKGNILNNKKLIIDYSNDDDMFTAKIKKVGNKNKEYTTALVQEKTLVNTLNSLNDYLAWYGKDMESSIDIIDANLDKKYGLLLLNGACSFVRIDSDYQRFICSRVSEKRASMFSMFPNIMKKVNTNDSMIMAITKKEDKYIIKSKDFLTGNEEVNGEFNDLLEGLVSVDKNINKEKKEGKVLCKKHY